MSKNLEQIEIDSLFDSTSPHLGGDFDGSGAAEIESFHFNRSEQMSAEQMKAVSTLNDVFARNLTHNLGAWLRTQFLVTLASGEQLTYGEFAERVPEVAYVCSLRLEPLDTVGIIQFDLELAAPIVDLLLGGVGRNAALREPTDIEDQILLSVMEIITRELNVAWQAVGLQFALERREMESAIGRLTPASEKVVCVCFEVRMPQVTGAFNICLPAIVLNTILRKLMHERDRPRRRTLESKTRITSLLAETSFRAVMQFPRMSLPTSDLVHLSCGQLIRLPLSSHSPAELSIGGVSLFVVQAVKAGEHRGAQVIRIAKQVSPLNESIKS